MSPSAAGTLPEDKEVNHVGDDGYDDDRDGVDDGGNHGKVIPESSNWPFWTTMVFGMQKLKNT